MLKINGISCWQQDIHSNRIVSYYLPRLLYAQNMIIECSHRYSIVSYTSPLPKTLLDSVYQTHFVSIKEVNNRMFDLLQLFRSHLSVFRQNTHFKQSVVIAIHYKQFALQITMSCIRKATN
jgi:hypothetical protein